MYIPKFWCGVAATLIIDIVAFIGYSFYIYRTEGDGDETT